MAPKRRSRIKKTLIRRTVAEKSSRPLAITLIVVFGFIYSIFLLIGGTGFIMDYTNSDVEPTIVKKLGILVPISGIVATGTGIAGIIGSYLLLKMRKISWKIIIGVSIVSVVSTVVAWIAIPEYPSFPYTAFIWIAVSFYLWKNREVFA